MRKILNGSWKLLLAMVGFAIALGVGGSLLQSTGLEPPALPEGTDQETLGAMFMAGSVLFALALAAVAAGLGGGFVTRALTLFLLMWIAYAVNNVIEGAMFTTYSAVATSSSMLYTALSLLLPSATMAVITALLFRSGEETGSLRASLGGLLRAYGTAGLLGRVVLAILAFPAIYLIVGMAIAPLVQGYYESGVFELALPGWGQLIPIQFLRSTLFLVASLPVILMWAGSRKGLLLALGLALFVFVGGFSMATAYWMGWQLRVVHSIEILVDELVYAAVLVALWHTNGEAGV
jgi:hypothetical protein